MKAGAGLSIGRRLELGGVSRCSFYRFDPPSFLFCLLEMANTLDFSFSYPVFLVHAGGSFRQSAGNLCPNQLLTGTNSVYSCP